MGSHAPVNNAGPYVGKGRKAGCLDARMPLQASLRRGDLSGTLFVRVRHKPGKEKILCPPLKMIVMRQSRRRSVGNAALRDDCRPCFGGELVFDDRCGLTAETVDLPPDVVQDVRKELAAWWQVLEQWLDSEPAG